MGGSGGEGSGKATRAYRGTLDWLELAGYDDAGLPDRFGAARFEDLSVLLASEGGFDLSEHSCGRAGGGL